MKHDKQKIIDRLERAAYCRLPTVAGWINEAIEHIEELHDELEISDRWRKMLTPTAEDAKQHNDKMLVHEQHISRLEAQLDHHDCDREQGRIAELEKQIPPKYDPEKRYTKEQLTEIMQTACDIMNLLPASSCKVMDFKNGGLSVYDGKNRITNPVEYHKPITEPEKGRVVMVRYEDPDRTLLLVSRGFFDTEGDLMCDCDLIKEADPTIGWIEWCDYLDRSHHSDGWDREWEPDYNGDAQ